MAIFTKRGTEITQEFIAQQMEKSDAWLYRSITAIYKWQTEDEKAIQATSHSNGVGFNAIDAHILSSFANKLLRVIFSRPNRKRLPVRKWSSMLGNFFASPPAKVLDSANPSWHNTSTSSGETK